MSLFAVSFSYCFRLQCHQISVLCHQNTNTGPCGWVFPVWIFPLTALSPGSVFPQSLSAVTSSVCAECWPRLWPCHVQDGQEGAVSGPGSSAGVQCGCFCSPGWLSLLQLRLWHLQQRCSPLGVPDVPCQAHTTHVPQHQQVSAEWPSFFRYLIHVWKFSRCKHFPV